MSLKMAGEKRKGTTILLSVEIAGLAGRKAQLRAWLIATNNLNHKITLTVCMHFPESVLHP